MNNILTITQLNYSVRHLLEMEIGQVWLTGEISNFTKPTSGHWYLTLKDEQAQVRAAMFRMKNQYVTFQPANGMQVLVLANVSLYEPRGDYQIIIDSMQLAGDGLLQKQFEQLKLTLAAKGLFAQSYKKKLPSFAKRIGIITSSTGAVLQDILNILKRRDPNLEIIIYPTLTQGKEAAADIVASINLANRRNECDLLIIARGGGSLEDLWCFNEEIVAYAIFHSQLPIVSAIGHETDITIADFVADLRAPTPSAAAELVSRDQQELIRQLHHQFDKINLAFDRLWSHKLNRFEWLTLRLTAQHPKRQLQIQQKQLIHIKHRLTATITQLFATKKQRWQALTQYVKHNKLPHYVASNMQYFNQLSQRLNFTIEKKLSQEQQKFQELCTRIDGLSPLKILARGYSVTQNQQGKIIYDAKQIAVGDRIETQLSRGNIVSEVISIK